MFFTSISLFSFNPLSTYSLKNVSMSNQKCKIRTKGLASMVYNFFHKKTASSGVKFMPQN